MADVYRIATGPGGRLFRLVDGKLVVPFAGSGGDDVGRPGRWWEAAVIHQAGVLSRWPYTTHVSEGDLQAATEIRSVEVEHVVTQTTKKTIRL